jgi:hypothetical protein
MRGAKVFCRKGRDSAEESRCAADGGQKRRGGLSGREGGAAGQINEEG